MGGREGGRKGGKGEGDEGWEGERGRGRVGGRERRGGGGVFTGVSYVSEDALLFNAEDEGGGEGGEREGEI